MHFAYRSPLSTAKKTIEEPSPGPTDIHAHKADIEALHLPIGRQTDLNVHARTEAQCQPKIENHFSKGNQSEAIKPHRKNLNQKTPNSHEWKEEDRTTDNNQQDIRNPKKLTSNVIETEKDTDSKANLPENSQSVNSSGLDPSSIQYKEFYNSEALKSDQAFRAKYGERSWMNHHIQSYHLNNPEP
jgi:hypothetical protein